MKKGFTLVELLVSIAILVVLFTISTINIAPLPSNTLESTNLDTLLADLRSQESQAMSKDSTYGVRFDSDSYTLFKGDFIQGSSANIVISLDPGITISNVSFPDNEIIFASGSGDVVGYSAGSDSFTLGSTVTGKTNTIRINKYGATY